MEIINTGSLRRIAYENTDDVEAAKLFTGIYGVGKSLILPVPITEALTFLQGGQ